MPKKISIIRNLKLRDDIIVQLEKKYSRTSTLTHVLDIKELSIAFKLSLYGLAIGFIIFLIEIVSFLSRHKIYL